MSDLIIKEYSAEDAEFVDFIESNLDEIEEIFPHFSLEESGYADAFLLIKENQIIGAFICRPRGEELHVDIDFLIHPYRDMGIGNDFFQQKLGEFKNQGFSAVVALTANETHIKYLKSCGFELNTKHPHWYQKDLRG